MTDTPRRIVLCAFTMNCVSHIQQGLWVRPDSRQSEYMSLEPWLELARICEAGKFDAVFFADVLGVYDTYGGSGDTAIRSGMQTPVNDPMLLVPALATVTEHLGLAFTSSIVQTHPFTFARQVSTLDHLTGGRVGWNIVTGYLENQARSLGLDHLPPHDERYDQADEYLEVLYKLWEGSWEEDAVVADRVAKVYADPSKVHRIDHHGRYYDCEGPHVCEPSPQRTPVLFQAGSSQRGRDFAATHAEATFIVANHAEKVVPDLRARAATFGRDPHDLKVIAGVSPIVGGTEAEAREKHAEYLEDLSVEAGLAHLSGGLQVDLANIDPDRPLDSIDEEGIQGLVKALIDSAPPGTRTFGDLVKGNMAGQFMVGSAEQVADRLIRHVNNGVDGFNLVVSTLPGTITDFVEGVVPILQERGYAQTEYTPGTLREKLTGAARLPDSHPAARYRR
jgi:FMN-dependent oxidoreductase (nitrilotriacetate monooxygenase family)